MKEINFCFQQFEKWIAAGEAVGHDDYTGHEKSELWASFQAGWWAAQQAGAAQTVQSPAPEEERTT